MPSRHRKNRTMRKRRNRYLGGGQGSGLEPGAPLVPGLGSDAQIHKAYDACAGAARPGQIAYSPTGGLPGMRGGAYTNNLENGIAGFAQIDKVGCQPNLLNPLNQHMRQSGGVGLQSAKDMGVYEASTARYSQAASPWTNSVGAPVLLNQPLDARMWSKACTQTAGRRKNRKNRTRKGKKSRKNRK